MSTSQSTDSQAFRGVVQGQDFITIPIDDPRNNPLFRKAHPYVIFEGYSKPKLKRVPDLSEVDRFRPEAISIVDNENIPPAPNLTVVQANSAQNAIASNLKNSEMYELSDDSSAKNQFFLFNEIAKEFYDRDFDLKIYPNDNNYVKKSTIGITNDMPQIRLVPPSDITSANELSAKFVKTQSKDGIPTYEYPIKFMSDNYDGDFEIRIVKA